MQFALYNLIHHPLKHWLCPCMLSHSRKNIIIIIIIIISIIISIIIIIIITIITIIIIIITTIVLRPGWNTSAHHFLLDFLVDPSGVFKHTDPTTNLVKRHVSQQIWGNFKFEISPQMSCKNQVTIGLLVKNMTSIGHVNITLLAKIRSLYIYIPIHHS